MTQVFDDCLIAGSADVAQLQVRANSTQTQPLQTWQNSGGTALARLTSTGRLQLGDLNVATGAALVEANATVTGTADPQRGVQAVGNIQTGGTPTLNWAYHELAFTGGGSLSGVQTALRGNLTNSINAGSAELRAGAFEATNQAAVGTVIGARGAAINGAGTATKVIGVQAGISNAAGGLIPNAAAFEVAPPVNSGTIAALYGLKVPTLSTTPGTVTNFAAAQLTDEIELGIQASTPSRATPAGYIKVYPKLSAGAPHLYAKDASGVEYDLSGTGGGGGGGITLDITVTAGETLAERDVVFVDPADSKAYKVDSDALPIKIGKVHGVVTQSGGIANGASGVVRLIGPVTGFSGLTPWVDLWASTTPGSYSQTRPAVTAGGGQRVLLRLGYATSATTAMLLTAPVQFARRESLAQGASLTLQHYADETTRLRKVWATNSVTTTVLTNYASSNVDVNVQLRGDSATGGSTSIVAAGTTAPIGDSPANWAAQSFTIAAGRLSQITIYLAVSTGTPSGNILWEMRDSISNQPGNVLQSGSFSPTANANNTIAVSNGVRLSASTTYWLVFRPASTQTAGNAYNVNTSSTDSYGGGSFLRSTNGGSTWTTSANSLDMYCSVTTAAIAVNDALAQSFSLGSASILDAARLWLSKAGSPTGTLTLRIETDNAGAPSGTLADAAATVTVAESSLGTVAGYSLFDFATPFTLSASTTYWLVLTTSRAASSSNYVQWGADASAPTYTSGELKTQASSTWITENKDASFEVLASATAFDEACVIGRESGGTRDVAVRFDDGSGGSADSRTTFRNWLPGTADLTCLVELQ